METLIELYDERPIENVLASEVFRPKRTVFLCPPEAAQDRSKKEALRKYFFHKGLDTELVFLETSLYHAEKVAKQFRAVTETYPGCVLDITGGTDAALFACGTVCGELDIPVFTYSRKRNSFFSIRNAPFSDALPCVVEHTVEDCFLMAGGALRKGRVDNAALKQYTEYYEPFFRLYLRNRQEWKRTVSYIQHVSQTERNAPLPLEVDAPHVVKGERGTRISAPENVLRELEKLGFLRELRMEGGRVAFRFRDGQVRSWLRDVGSVLELYIYKVCVDTGLFGEVLSSAVVDWEGSFRRDNVTNEIDVMAMRGVLPVFLSCKTCAVTTEALNELAILRDRFGGQGARAAIVTTQRCQTVTRHRANELGIDVIDLDDLKSGRTGEILRALMR